MDYNARFNFNVYMSELETEDNLDFYFSKYIDRIKEDKRIIGVGKSAIWTSTPKQVAV
jgi:hypothetical protein